jgi:hypothetical protein
MSECVCIDGYEDGENIIIINNNIIINIIIIIIIICNLTDI